jgi:hypothetical protein
MNGFCNSTSRIDSSTKPHIFEESEDSMIAKSTLMSILSYAFIAPAVLGLEGGSSAAGTPAGIALLSDEAFEKLSRARIYFGHQSVGSNIMEGVKDLMGKSPRLSLTIRETADPIPSQEGAFTHGPVGRNEDPASKTDDFAVKINGGVGAWADVAFFKFCYIDIMAEQDVDKVLFHYKKTMADLKKAYPKTTFVHVTAPLTIVQTGPKVFIKKMIGRAPGGYLDNARRNEYNRKLRQAYAGKEPIFDLAQIESTYPDGGRATFEWKGQAHERMIPEYGSDGRHLNEPGRQRVAEQLLVFLSTLPL